MTKQMIWTEADCNALCRDRERAGFAEGIKVGVLLQTKLSEK